LKVDSPIIEHNMILEERKREGRVRSKLLAHCVPLNSLGQPHPNSAGEPRCPDRLVDDPCKALKSRCHDSRVRERGQDADGGIGEMQWGL